jgi:nucleotidyltransferase-like protein
VKPGTSNPTLATEAYRHIALYDSLVFDLIEGIQKNMVAGPIPGDAAMNRQAVLDRLTAESRGLRSRFGVKDMAVFGSVARNQAHEREDLYLLVTFDGTPDFDRFMDLKFYL